MRKYYFRYIEMYDDDLMKYEIIDNPDDDTPFILNDMVYLISTPGGSLKPFTHIDNQPAIKKALIYYKLNKRKNKLDKI